MYIELVSKQRKNYSSVVKYGKRLGIAHRCMNNRQPLFRIIIHKQLRAVAQIQFFQYRRNIIAYGAFA